MPSAKCRRRVHEKTVIRIHLHRVVPHQWCEECKTMPERAAENRFSKKRTRIRLTLRVPPCRGRGRGWDGLHGFAIPSGGSQRCTQYLLVRLPSETGAHLCFIDLLLLCGIYCGIRRKAFPRPTSLPAQIAWQAFGPAGVSRLNWLAFFCSNFSVFLSFLRCALDFVGCKNFSRSGYKNC